jgi:hypothetical protein
LFHVVFIAVSILLSLFAGVWGIRLYAMTGEVSGLGVGVVFLALAATLVVYGVRTFRKLRDLD